ncbi:MAG: phosphoadenylyl-sulfate reductase [Paracoccaceae bacterium]
MPRKDLAQNVARLNATTWADDATGLLDQVLNRGLVGRVALVSSFGAESAVLLHLLAQVNRAAPVIFIDTQMLFAETLDYQTDLASRFGLTNVRRVTADELALRRADPWGNLHQRDTDACCDLRKTQVLDRALAGFDGWISGRKRHQAGTRAALEMFEADEAQSRIKINPLAYWTAQDIAAYFEAHALPRHPLVARGYPSIGCAPCTSAVRAGEDARAGRWRGQDKEECGIHLVNGKWVRTAA